MQPSKPADKYRLIRRVSLDLTGIPPTPAEIDAFVADNSPNAYEKVVDRLLASPRYGEQMAIAWLDYARYADSHGYQNDPERYMSHWRDWVIEAYNKNMPFDEFTVDQIAGDLLPNATYEQKLATGFNRNHRMNAEGGIIDEEFRIDGVIDQVETTSQTWLGLTMGCCRCHDHKYDPITQKEFYQFSAYFNSVNEVGAFTEICDLDRGANAPPLMRVYSAEDIKRQAEIKPILESAESKLRQFHQRLPELERQYAAHRGPTTEPNDPAIRFTLDNKPEGLDAAGKAIPVTLQGKPTFVDSTHGKVLKIDGAGSYIVAGDIASYERTDAVTYGAWINAQNFAPIFSRMEGGADYRGFDLYYEEGKISAHIIHQWPISAIKITTNTPIPLKQWVHVMATYDGSSKASGLKIYVNGISQPFTVSDDTLNDTIITPASFKIGRRSDGPTFNGLISDVRFYRRLLTPAEILSLANPHLVDSIIQIPLAQRTADQNNELAKVLLGSDPEYVKVASEIDKARADALALSNMNPNTLGGPNTTMIMQDLPKPRDTFVLGRGQYNNHGEKVGPGVPAILPPLPADAPPNRLALARWIVDPANPLTARVQANRLWEKFFGIGIVKSSENLGTQADWPSNPELLDYLATELIRLKWDLKYFQKEMIMSAAYQQDSSVSPELLERDPDNRLIARGPRVRLSAETVRDQALAASGLLVEKIGGPSVRPYEPGNIWERSPYGNLNNYVPDKGDSLYRRSLYTFWKRTAPPPNLSTFDMPSREVCVVKRGHTNTPLQALDLLNDPTYVEAARVLAQHMMLDSGTSPTEHIANGFYRVLCRKPNAEESNILLAGFAKQLEKFHANPDAAAKFISLGDTKPDLKLAAPELAAYTMIASEILNLDETVTKQ